MLITPCSENAFLYHQTMLLILLRSEERLQNRYLKHSIKNVIKKEQNKKWKINYIEVVGKLFDMVEKMTEILAKLDKSI